jgi:hypothetical protein
MDRDSRRDVLKKAGTAAIALSGSTVVVSQKATAANTNFDPDDEDETKQFVSDINDMSQSQREDELDKLNDDQDNSVQSVVEADRTKTSYEEESDTRQEGLRLSELEDDSSGLDTSGRKRVDYTWTKYAGWGFYPIYSFTLHFAWDYDGEHIWNVDYYAYGDIHANITTWWYYEGVIGDGEDIGSESFEVYSEGKFEFDFPYYQGKFNQDTPKIRVRGDKAGEWEVIEEGL